MNKRLRKKKDIKYLGVPNVCFSITEKHDKRERRFRKQRIETGFDDSETWNLDNTICDFIIPRLKVYQKIANKVLLREKSLVDKIDKFLLALQLYRNESFVTDEQENIIKEGFSYFPEIFKSLWW